MSLELRLFSPERVLPPASFVHVQWEGDYLSTVKPSTPAARGIVSLAQTLVVVYIQKESGAREGGKHEEVVDWNDSALLLFAMGEEHFPVDFDDLIM